MATSELGTGMELEYRHEALIYCDAEEFLATALPFVEAGLDGGEPVAVTGRDCNRRLLTGELGAAAEGIRFVANEELGRNPARLISFWRDLLAEGDGGPVRGIAEPVWPGRDSAEVDECERHEALLNRAFPQSAPLSLLCAYDGSALSDEVLRGVFRSHDKVFRDGVPHRSGGYRAARDAYGGELSEPPDDALAFEFGRAGLGDVRRRVEGAAEGAGLGPRATADVVVAASELAANSIAHAGGGGTFRLWVEGDRLMVEFEDAGRIEEPLAGRLRPEITQEGGRGLWLANQLCDLVQIRSGERGTVVRLRAAAD